MSINISIKSDNTTSLQVFVASLSNIDQEILNAPNPILNLNQLLNLNLLTGPQDQNKNIKMISSNSSNSFITPMNKYYVIYIWNFGDAFTSDPDSFIVFDANGNIMKSNFYSFKISNVISYTDPSRGYIVNISNNSLWEKYKKVWIIIISLFGTILLSYLIYFLITRLSFSPQGRTGFQNRI